MVDRASFFFFFLFSLSHGHAVVVVYGFLGCFALSIFLALSMAEISSPFGSRPPPHPSRKSVPHPPRIAVTAGGPYNWSGALAGTLGKVPSYVVGWVLLLAAFGGVGTAIQASNQAVSINSAIGVVDTHQWLMHNESRSDAHLWRGGQRVDADGAGAEQSMGRASLP